MGTGLSITAGRDLQTLFRVGVTAAMSDQQLLEQFLARRGSEGEDAFAALVDRHGPMVWRVCQRALADHNDAEDAFQVTFLVLARKARSIARRPLLANWLYGVAVRSAKDVKAAAARRRAHEARYSEMRRPNCSDSDDVDPLLSMLDREINKLPEIFRSPVILCDLEGKSHREAAHLLGVPLGTIASRLSRGRDRLRQRLARHGCNVSQATLAAALYCDSRVIPHALVAGTAQLADRIVTGGTVAAAIPASLISLTDGVTRSMLLAKNIARSSIVLFGVALSVGGASALAIVGGRPGLNNSVVDGQARGPDAFLTKEPAWIDGPHKADERTKERLKRCVTSALTNYAAIARATYEFDFRQEVAQLDDSGEPVSITVKNYQGKVYWRNGSVRYDFEGPSQMPPFSDDKRAFRVIRTKDVLAYSDEDPIGRGTLHVEDAPASVQIWHQRLSQMAQLDPWVFYAKNIRTDEPDYQRFCETAAAIQSAEGQSTIVIRMRRGGDDDARIELICDKAADCLPTKYRIGVIREGLWIPWAEESCEWRKTGEVWFPAHQVTIGYVGKNHKPVKFFDLTVRNIRVNGDADVPDSVFTPGSKLPRDGSAANRTTK
jgi:RNA polymerase sigma factor (sigma-70 family)